MEIGLRWQKLWVVDLSNRQVAKNAVYLYLRTIVTTIVGIYTSRVVLQTLGIEDYGLYNVVGGVVGLFGFINGAMSGSTSRFITFELGKGDKQRLHDTFNSAMIVHLIIAGIVLLLAETVGLWFLNNKLVVPEGRMWAAQWVYQLSIVSALIGITQVPYDACLVAHERFDVSAYISMFSTFAKLGILYLVAYLPYDNLVCYAVLILVITVIARIFARVCCIRKFEESKFRWIVNKELLKPMLSFSGWEMFGWTGHVVYEQGRSVVVNLFYGVAVNAAVALGNVLSGAVNGFAYNIIQAFRPSITKSVAVKDDKAVLDAIIKAGFISFLLFSMFAIPMIVERKMVLLLWLGDIPPYTSAICAINLTFSNFMMLSIVLNATIQAYGKNKRQNLYPSLVKMLSVVVMCCLAYMETSLILVYLILQLAVVFSFVNALYLFARYVSKDMAKYYFTKAILRSSVGFFIQFALLYIISLTMDQSLFKLIVVSFISVALSFAQIMASPYRRDCLLFLKQKFETLSKS